MPYYETLHVQDAIKFYHDIADLFPTLNIVIYHNPDNHKFTIPVSAFNELVKKPNIIGMKDSHRTTQAFMNLQKIVKGKISVFVNQSQLVSLLRDGRRRLLVDRSLDGPWPILYLLEQVRKGDNQKAMEVIEDLGGDRGGKPVPGSGNKRPAGIRRLLQSRSNARAVCHLPRSKARRGESARGALEDAQRKISSIGRGRPFPVGSLKPADLIHKKPRNSPGAFFRIILPTTWRSPQQGTWAAKQTLWPFAVIPSALR